MSGKSGFGGFEGCFDMAQLLSKGSAAHGVRSVSKKIEPMEARRVDELPRGPNWQYEPKWDGFRCMVSKNGARVELFAKSGKSLSRYFPEIVDAFGKLNVKILVVDGELVIYLLGKLSFEALQMRLHPAASRVAKLSCDTPATFIAFDLLVEPSGRRISTDTFDVRRAKLDRLKASFDCSSITVTGYTRDRRPLAP